MNNEIKEILEYLTRFNNEDKYSYSPYYLLDTEEIWLLYDYITNLQQENERLRTALNGSDNKIEKLGYFDLTKDKNEKDENGNDLELHYTGVADTFDNVYEKINELIDEVNKLKENK